MEIKKIPSFYTQGEGILIPNELYDGDGKLNLTIEWDDEDPVESQFNDWTANDFLNAIRNACDKELPLGNTIRSDISKRLHLAGEGKEDISGV